MVYDIFGSAISSMPMEVPIDIGDTGGISGSLRFAAGQFDNHHSLLGICRLPRSCASYGSGSFLVVVVLYWLCIRGGPLDSHDALALAPPPCCCAIIFCLNTSSTTLKLCAF